MMSLNNMRLFPQEVVHEKRKMREISSWNISFLFSSESKYVKLLSQRTPSDF